MELCPLVGLSMLTKPPFVIMELRKEMSSDAVRMSEKTPPE